MATTTRVLDAYVNGVVYTGNVNDALEALDTCHSGSTAPTDEVANGKLWLDTSATPSVLKIYDNGNWNVIYSSRGDFTVGGTGAVKLPSGTDAQRPTPALGQMRFNTTIGSFEGYDGSEWGAIGGGGEISMLKYKYTATAGQVTFSGSDDSAVVLAYTQQNLIVTLNGIVLEDGTDYTATNGSSIVLSSAAAAGDELNIVAFNSFSVDDTVPASIGGSFAGPISAPQFSTSANKIKTAIFRTNAKTITQDTTIDADENASAAGPITVASGVTLTVAAGGTLTIV
jgi:hypothetical protein